MHSQRFPKVSSAIRLDFWKLLGLTSVAEPKLFVSSPSPARTFKKFPLRSRLQLRLELFGYLFSQLLSKKVDFPWLFGKNIDFIHFFDPIQCKLWLNTLGTLVWLRARGQRRSRNFSILAWAPAKSFGSLRLHKTGVNNTASAEFRKLFIFLPVAFRILAKRNTETAD